ncbi:hypothetical protein ECZU18_30560 [Escherichia coli]|nr:hypothetical protein ECZU18_30560 [Escherichia coli]
MRISGPQECREYRYSGTGRLTGVHTTAANPDIDIPYATDPAGNRLPDPELHPDSTSRHGRITASRKMRTMSTATMNTAGWRRRRTASRKG